MVINPNHPTNDVELRPLPASTLPVAADRSLHGRSAEPDLDGLPWYLRPPDVLSFVPWEVQSPEVVAFVRHGQRDAEASILQLLACVADDPVETFRSHCLTLGRVHGPSLLVDYLRRGLIDDVHLGQLLADVWTDAELPEQSLGTNEWVALFRRAGFCRDESSDVEAPTDPLTIYRGATWRRRRGMSWTTDPEIAEFFCDYRSHRLGHCHGGPMVFSVAAQPDAVLALIDGRNEHEVVVDPSLLPPMRRPMKSTTA